MSSIKVRIPVDKAIGFCDKRNKPCKREGITIYVEISPEYVIRDYKKYLGCAVFMPTMSEAELKRKIILRSTPLRGVLEAVCDKKRINGDLHKQIFKIRTAKGNLYGR